MKLRDLSKEHCLPLDKYTIKTDLWPYELYRTVIDYGSEKDFGYNKSKGRFHFYSRQEFERFKKFLKKRGIDFEDIELQINNQEDDTVQKNSPVPSPGFRDVF